MVNQRRRDAGPAASQPPSALQQAEGTLRPPPAAFSLAQAATASIWQKAIGQQNQASRKIAPAVIIKPAQPGKAKQPKVVTATISGLIFAAIVLLAETGIWGFYCYSRTLPGDTNVQASTFMYCLAVFAGSFWAAAVVKRRSLKPSLFICGVFLGLSLLISLHLFSWQEIKLKMLLLKILLTFAAAAGGFVLSLVPYLINKSIKKKRQAQEQRRQRQLEHRQMMQQQRELEQELARRARNNFRP